VNVRITRSGDTTGASSVSVASANGTATAPADYLALPATVVNFAAGETSKTVAVTVKGDSIPEYHEAFSLKLTSPTNASIIDAAGTVIITDDDAGAPASLSIANVQIGEPVGAAAPVALTITRSGDTSQAVTVKWATAPGTAASGIDFVAVAPTSLSFPAGVTTQTVSVTVNSDAIVEGTELFNVNISSAVNAVITDGSAAVTIFDDDY
jgi:hypothetical protein